MTTLQTTAQYENTERLSFHAQIRRVESAPFAERKEGMRDFSNSLGVDFRLAERAEWILNGSYGFGCYLIAKEIATNKRMNRAAWFGQTIAALDHGCPAEMARKAFLALPKAQQDKLNSEVIKAIDDFFA